MHFPLQGPAGRLDALLDEPGIAPVALAVVAHPHPQYGGTMQSRVVFEMAQALLRVGAAVVRFNYRGVGLSAGTFTEEGAREDFRAVLEAAAARFAPLPVWALGYSLGAWVAMTVGARDPRVEALVGVAPVVGHYDFEDVVTSGTPTFLVAAGADEMTPARQVQQFYGRLGEPRELVVVDGADHAFTGMAIEVGDAVEQLLGAS